MNKKKLFLDCEQKVLDDIDKTYKEQVLKEPKKGNMKRLTEEEIKELKE